MKKPSEKARARSFAGLFASASLVAVTSMMAAPAEALVVRDDVGVDGAVDTTNQLAGVGQMFNRQYDLNTGAFLGTFLCTGTLINPRTVVFAQHCTNAADATFDPGVGNHMSFGFDPLGANLDNFQVWAGTPTRRNPFTGDWRSYEELNYYNVLQVQTPFNNTEFFPGGDIAIASFDAPVVGLPTYGMLFSPLTGPTHATVGGFGTTGIGSEGDNVPIDFKRRVGENMIDGLFSQNDFIAAEFGVPGFGFGTADSAQLLYHIDFDNPNRDPDNCQRGEFFGTGNGHDLVCLTGPYASSFTLDGSSGVLIDDQINWYGGDALPNEAGTAGGDSGSALFADQIYSRSLVTGVLSGGWVNGVASPFGGYGDVAYDNPLFLFLDWLVENNPYVYASARDGNRNWSNPSTWVQNMDPNYFYIDRLGRVRNGLPSDAQPGYFADDPKWGTVFDTDVSGGFGDEGPDQYLCQIDGVSECPPGVTASGASGLTDNGVATLEDAEHGGGSPGGSSSTGPTASRGGPTGPGSTRFVPNNDYGTYGSWTGSADGTARFYDVTLNNNGRTRLDMNVEIDNLTISGWRSELDVRSGYNINSLVAVDQFAGLVNVDGSVGTREYMLWSGVLTGNGAINAATLYNIDGVISAGDLDRIGNLTVNADYVQSSHADLLVNVRRQGNTITNDLLSVNGAASLDGNVFVAPVNSNSRARFNDSYTVLHANSVVGNFDDVYLIASGPALYGESIVQASGDVDIVVRARHIGHMYAGSGMESFGNAIDQLRWGGHFTGFQGLFDAIDGASFDTFGATLLSLTPTNAFATVPLAVQHTQSFSLGLDQRTTELRAGVRGLSTSSIIAGAHIFGTTPNAAALTSAAAQNEEDASPIGFFVSGQGNVTELGAQAYEGDRYNPMSISAFNSAEMTLGADYRVRDGLALGVATTISRYLTRDANTGVTPMDHVGYSVMAYATTWNGPWHLDSYVGVARHEYEMSRTLGVSLTDMGAAPSAVQTLAGVRAGYEFEPMDGLTFGPMIGVSYSNLNMDGYRENGDQNFALEVDSRLLRSVTVETAMQFAYQPVRNGVASNFTAHGRIGLATELGDGVDLLSAHFLAAPDAAFDMTRALDRQWMTAATGVSFQINDNMSANLEAVSDVGRGELSSTSVRAGFNWNF
ncbi:MAG: autotransporter domain-containing protein [Hyphomonadaceae bacterium]